MIFPQVAHTSPDAYTRALVRRHSDIGFIRAAVLRDFGTAPSREKIHEMRAQFILERMKDAGEVQPSKFTPHYQVGSLVPKVYPTDPPPEPAKPVKARPPHLVTTLDRVLWAAYEATGISPRRIKDKTRAGPVVRVRHAVVFVVREKSTLSLPQIGSALGRRDHSSVCNSIKQARVFMERDPAFAELVDTLKAAA